MGYVCENLNPLKKKTADSEVRAVAKACGISWEEAFTGLFKIALEKKLSTYDVEVVDAFLVSKGFTSGKIAVRKGVKRPIVAQFAKDYPNLNAVLRISGFYVACSYGNYYGIFDCGNNAVYKYWYKQIR